jgi:GYF domain 2
MTIHLCHQGRQLGDFSKEQVEAMLKAGVINDGTLAWASGLPEWKALREFLGATTPPAVPSPQTVAATVLGQPPGHSKPTDDIPKRELPSSPSTPPVIAAPVFEARLSERVRQEILKLTKVPWGQKIVRILFILSFFLLATSLESEAKAGASLSIPLTLLCGVFVFRRWCERCTMRIILKRGTLRPVYWAALWSFGWRSLCMGMAFSLFFGMGADSPNEQTAITLVLFILWVFLSLLAVDVPYASRKTVERIAETDCATTMPPPQVKSQDK